MEYQLWLLEPSIPVQKSLQPPEEIKEIEDRIADPYTLTGKDRLRALYKMQGLEFDENIFEKIIEEYHLDEL